MSLQEPQMVSSRDRYLRVCARLDALYASADTSFTRFVQLSLAVIGGFFWLKLQPGAAALSSLLTLTRWVLPVLSTITVVEIALCLWGWWGFRKAEAELANDSRLLPRLPRSGRTEFFRILVAAGIGFAGYYWLR